MRSNSKPTQPCSKCGGDSFGSHGCRKCRARYMKEWRIAKPRIDPTLERLPATRKELTAIFSRITINPDISYNGSYCWLWIGHLNHNGYARIYYRRNQHQGHRLLFQMFVKIIQGQDQGDHLCRVRRCVNPAHVEDVNGRVNTLRGENRAAQNARKTHCKHGHEFTPENTVMKKHRGNLTRVCLTCRRVDGVKRWHKLHPDASYRQRSLGHETPNLHAGIAGISAEPAVSAKAGVT